MLANLALASLGSLIALAKPLLKSLATFLEWSGVVIAALELGFGPKRIEKALRHVWLYVGQIGESINPLGKFVKQRVFMSTAGTEGEPASPWWQDGPVHGAFLCLVWGSPHLYLRIERLYEITATSLGLGRGSIELVVKTPIILSSFVAGLLILFWIPSALRAVGILISGLWRPSGVGYWAWCEPKMARIREKADDAFYNRPLPETQSFAKPKLYQYLVGYFMLLLFFGLVWQGIAILLLIGGCLILAGQLLKKAAVAKESATGANQPRAQFRTLIKPRPSDILFASFALPVFFGLIWPGIAYLLLLGGCLWLLAVLLQFASALLGLSARFGRWPKAGPAIAILGFLLSRLVG